MIEIAELQKLIQDLIAPDLKALAAEQESAKSLARARYDTVLAKLEVLEIKLNAFDLKTSLRFNETHKALDIDKRMERIEARYATSNPTA